MHYVSEVWVSGLGRPRIHQVFGIQVGGEDDQLLERNPEAFAGMQLEEVVATLQRRARSSG